MVAEGVAIFIHPVVIAQGKLIRATGHILKEHRDRTKLKSALLVGGGRVVSHLAGGRNTSTHAEAFEDNIRFCVDFTHNLSLISSILIVRSALR